MSHRVPDSSRTASSRERRSAAAGSTGRVVRLPHADGSELSPGESTVSPAPPAERSATLVGRESELATLSAFLHSESPARALALSGGPGIGKTSLWEAAIAVARERGLRALVARPAAAEVQFAFAALIDLFDGVSGDELAALPGPQRDALEEALLRAEPAESRSEPSAISVGVLNALRALASSDRLLVAIDDLHWLDTASADALAFSARRLEDERVRFLVTKRPGPASVVERALDERGQERLEVQPLSLGATRLLLSARLGLALPRRLLVRLFELAGGSPMFALELGRTLVGRELPAIGEDIPFPDSLDDLIGARVTALPQEARRVLLAVALAPDLRVSQLESLARTSDIDSAVDAGVVAVDGERVRPAHPLLAAAALRHSRPSERATLHGALAEVASDTVRRGRHLALSASTADPNVADTIAAIAKVADARGARSDAVELAEHALRLTPDGRNERTDRLLVLAEYLAAAGERERVKAMLESEIPALPAGKVRARAWLRLLDSLGTWTRGESDRYLGSALTESEGDAGLRAAVLARRADAAAAVHVERLEEAENWALQALADARHADAEVEQLALYALAWARSLRGRPIDDLLERSFVHREAVHGKRALDRVVCDRLAWRGEVSEARAIVKRLLVLAEERGESRAYFALLAQRCEIELHAGELEVASRLLDEWEQSSDRFVAPVFERDRLLVAVMRGLPDEIARWAPDVLARSEALESGWDLLEGLRARGVADLFAHNYEWAVESLRRVWSYTEREGIEDPGAFPVAPDLVESLVELGELDEARAVASRVAAQAEKQAHPWGLLTARRCGALIALSASAYDEQAASDLADAADGYGNLGLRFDRARSLLSAGRAQRRLRKWRAARGSLEQAAAAFDELASTGWAEAARSELARVGARRPRAEGELTNAERRVAELAIEGLSNKEIARALVVTVATVEAHLSRIYAKLGIRSRTQLQARLSAGSRN